MAPWHRDTILGVVGRMLGPLCKLLGPSIARLKTYIQEAEQLFSQSVDGKTTKEKEEVVEDLNKQ